MEKIKDKKSKTLLTLGKANKKGQRNVIIIYYVYIHMYMCMYEKYMQYILHSPFVNIYIVIVMQTMKTIPPELWYNHTERMGGGNCLWQAVYEN